MERENLKSRLGFILLSAGCAIGIGMYGSSRTWPARAAVAHLYCFI